MIAGGLLTALVLGASTLLQTQTAAPGAEDPVFQACMAQDGDRDACLCVSREAASRFSPNQQTIIAAAMPDMRRVGEPQALVDQLGLSFDQILNLRQRAQRADTVIRAACGRGLGAE